MIKVFTIGHNIPDQIKSNISKWNDWTWIVVASKPNKNKDAKRLMEKIEPDVDKVAVYKSGELEIYVSYLFPI